MTQWNKTKVSCPACLEESEFRICSFIDICKDPDLKESIFNRDIFRFSCSECSEEILVAYNCTYLDTDKNFMVALLDTDSTDAAIEAKDYTLRLVRSINEFVEKIALMEDGIDDRIIELYKIMLEDQFEEDRPGSEILGIFYAGQNPDDRSLMFYIITQNAENVRAVLSFDTYEAIVKQFDQNPNMAKPGNEINREWAVRTLQIGFSDNE